MDWKAKGRKIDSDVRRTLEIKEEAAATFRGSNVVDICFTQN